MKDKIGKIPKITSRKHALQEIYKITKDKKRHVLLKDDNDWLELKLRVIGIIARRGGYK